MAKTILYIHRGGKVGIGPGLYRDAIEAMGGLPNGQYVCKPTLGQCGRDIIIARIENGNVSFANEEAEDSFHAGTAKEPYIVQEFIVQHESMKALNPTSVNTVRINTTRFNQNSHYFVSMVRIGVTDALVDNAAAGGTCVGVDFETGRLMKYGCYHSKPRETHHPITGIKYENYQIPYWTESVNLVLYLHQYFRGFPSLGWDVAITESGPKLIENNYDWAFGILQQIHGGLKKKWERAKLLP